MALMIFSIWNSNMSATFRGLQAELEEVKVARDCMHTFCSTCFAEVSAGTGSNLADFSDSSNPSAVRSMSRGQAFLHSAHPRYQNSWTVLQDAQKRNLVPTPEYSGIGVSASLSPLDSSCDSAFTSPNSASSSLELRCRGTLNIQLFPKASCISQHLARRTDQGGYALARHAARDAETL